jgi:hypothetical protein
MVLYLECPAYRILNGCGKMEVWYGMGESDARARWQLGRGGSSESGYFI